ncbi:portal protein [Gluconobacter potus]|uniref:Portal protein n=1 Tax=Gluconobacter potus TaxID=2724927 RepID=A0A149QPK0_9PROT|nr:phage portal protein [Gluconobacter potus]KXU99244.1 portal protein [Gluconobacter potus]
MDWQTLKATYNRQSGLPSRACRIEALLRVLDGTQYDDLPYDFMTERTGAGEYISLSKRRPSVRTNLCRTVVDDSVSLLFGDTHWPTLCAENEQTSDALEAFSRNVGLPAVMSLAATRGSVGSIAVLVEIYERKPVLTVLDTAYLTPTWNDAGVLMSVHERYQTKGRELAERGYTIPEEQMTLSFWWERTFTQTDADYMVPQPVNATEPPVRDDARSVQHGLGFVPIVWMRNSEVTGDTPDGQCTFEMAIDTVIEADYLMSQGCRALRYASDPTLVLTSGNEPGHDGPAHQGGSASALQLPPGGDAKLLEINGQASGAVLTQYQELRALVLEQLHGNRAHSDKIAAGTSGRAMEMMCLPLVWLASRLRQAYGDSGLVPLYRMICDFSRVIDGGLEIDGNTFRELDPAGMRLHWPSWFEPSEAELLALAQALVTAVDGGLIANETACVIYAGRLGIPDASSEWERVKAEISSGAKVAKSPKETRTDANGGKTLSHQETA